LLDVATGEEGGQPWWCNASASFRNLVSPVPPFEEQEKTEKTMKTEKNERAEAGTERGGGEGGRGVPTPLNPRDHYRSHPHYSERVVRLRGLGTFFYRPTIERDRAHQTTDSTARSTTHRNAGGVDGVPIIPTMKGAKDVYGEDDGYVHNGYVHNGYGGNDADDALRERDRRDLIAELGLKATTVVAKRGARNRGDGNDIKGHGNMGNGNNGAAATKEKAAARGVGGGGTSGGSGGTTSGMTSNTMVTNAAGGDAAAISTATTETPKPAPTSVLADCVDGCTAAYGGERSQPVLFAKCVTRCTDGYVARKVAQAMSAVSAANAVPGVSAVDDAVGAADHPSAVPHNSPEAEERREEGGAGGGDGGEGGEGGSDAVYDMGASATADTAATVHAGSVGVSSAQQRRFGTHRVLIRPLGLPLGERAGTTVGATGGGDEGGETGSTPVGTNATDEVVGEEEEFVGGGECLERCDDDGRDPQGLGGGSCCRGGGGGGRGGGGGGGGGPRNHSSTKGRTEGRGEDGDSTFDGTDGTGDGTYGIDGNDDGMGETGSSNGGRGGRGGRSGGGRVGSVGQGVGAFHVYACPQPLFKLHPVFDDILCRIVRSDPMGHVVLLQVRGGESERDAMCLSGRQCTVVTW
jgi:hypothetical protein